MIIVGIKRPLVWADNSSRFGQRSSARGCSWEEWRPAPAGGATDVLPLLSLRQIVAFFLLSINS